MTRTPFTTSDDETKLVPARRSSIVSALQRIGATFILLVVATVILDWSGADKAFPAPFYDEAEGVFPLLHHKALLAFDRLAVLPAFGIAIGSLIYGVSEYVKHRTKGPLRAGIFLTIALIVGPGLLINGTKAVWGRPRPRDTKVFGGPLKYHPVWILGADRINDRSFPCGHASMGFYLMTPMFLGAASRRKDLSVGFLIIGLTWGALIGASRFVQGGHFVSDIMWSAGLVYMTGVALQAILLGRFQSARTVESPNFEMRLAA